MSRYELLSLLGAAVALVILAAFLLRRRSTRTNCAEQERRLPAPERDEWKPTELRVALVGSADERRFVFTNAGPGIARNVSFDFGDAGGWSPPVISAQFRELFPIGEFQPSQQITCIAALHLGHPAVFTGVYSWEDEDGVKHETTCRIPS
jgi:hypothetical protein